jgi:tetratricopeptide (TPR) repeat protein
MRALELNPNESTINYDMGFFLNKRGLYYQADKYYAKAAELDPVSFKNYRNRGIISFNLGNLNKAIDYLQTALDFESDDIPTRLWLARSNILLEKYREAEKHLNICESIDSGPQEPAILKTRALLSAAKGNSEEAINLLNASGFTDNYSRISVYSLLGMKGEAIAILNAEPIAKAGNHYGADYLIMQHNHIFDSIRNTNEFQEALKKAKEIYDEALIKYENVFL